jgi:hypothetical protein
MRTVPDFTWCDQGQGGFTEPAGELAFIANYDHPRAKPKRLCQCESLLYLLGKGTMHRSGMRRFIDSPTTCATNKPLRGRNSSGKATHSHSSV